MQSNRSVVEVVLVKALYILSMRMIAHAHAHTHSMTLGVVKSLKRLGLSIAAFIKQNKTRPKL